MDKICFGKIITYQRYDIICYIYLVNSLFFIKQIFDNKAENFRFNIIK